MKTIPMLVKFDRQGHSRSFYVGFGPATSTNLYVHPPPAYFAGRTRERVSPYLSCSLVSLSLSLFIFLLSYYLPGTFDCSDRRERKHSHSTECPKFRLSAQSKVIEPVLGKKGLQSRISPICTLSQNGYGACPAVLSPKQCFVGSRFSEVSLTDLCGLLLGGPASGRLAGGRTSGWRAGGGSWRAGGGWRAAGT